MREQTSFLKLSLLLASLTVLAACGNANNNAPSVSPTGKTHPAGWVQLHGAAAAPACTECHGEDLSGGITRVGCFSNPQTTINGFACHAVSPAVDKGCTSCHGTPPNGNVAPNRQGAHAKHLALSGMTCGTCHHNAGFGTPGHAKATANGGIARATVSLLDAPSFPLKAKTGAAFSYDPAGETCSGIICHGGQQTPSWSVGSIIVAKDCLKCHAQGSAPVAPDTTPTPQYNSFFSGTAFGANLHKLHLLEQVPGTTTPVFCTDCHTLSSLHFAALTTPAFEATAASTIGGAGTRITSYLPAQSGSCTSSCHATNNNNPRNWIN